MTFSKQGEKFVVECSGKGLNVNLGFCLAIPKVKNELLKKEAKCSFFKLNIVNANSFE